MGINGRSHFLLVYPGVPTNKRRDIKNDQQTLATMPIYCKYSESALTTLKFSTQHWVQVLLNLFKWWSSVQRLIGELLVYAVRPSSFSNISSEATEPVEAKFYVEPPWIGVTKVPSNGHCHMTKMATTLIYTKILNKVGAGVAQWLAC